MIIIVRDAVVVVMLTRKLVSVYVIVYVWNCVTYRYLFFTCLPDYLHVYFNSNLNCSGRPTAARRPCKQFWMPSAKGNLAVSYEKGRSCP